MDPMIAYCGLNCTECPSRIHTLANDEQALEKLAEQWRTEFSAPDTTINDVRCMGCLSASGPLCSYCAKCEVRACASERGVANCAHCADYGCDKITGFFQMAPQAKTTLDAIRAGLGLA